MFRSLSFTKVFMASMLATSVPAGFFFLYKGFTHLNVQEKNLKMLVGPNSSSTTSLTGLNEQFRDGTVSSMPYQVPSGKVFIITDISSYAIWSSGILPFVELFEATNKIELWSYTGQFVPSVDNTVNEHLSGGIISNSGSTLAVFSANANSGIIRILGYETEQ